jgi:hypothetical protein
MRPRTLAVAVIVAAMPALAVADRGALTLEVSPAFTWWPAWGPPVGSGSGVSGWTAGGLLGLRYAVRNELELTATGFYEVPADFTNPGTTVDAGTVPLTGTTRATVSRWGVLLGARWVQGLVWRWFVGAELGYAQQQIKGVDLIDVSDPVNPRSFGLEFPVQNEGAFVLSPLAGIEWQFADRWSVAFTPRLQVMLGGVSRVAVVLPVSLGYSWYGL